MAKKVKEVTQDKISITSFEPLSKLCFNFSYMTSNKRYSFKKIDNGNKIKVYESFTERLIELSKIDVNYAHQIGKTKDLEKIPYRQLSESMKQVCSNTNIVFKDSKVSVFRFNNQNYRIICKDDVSHPNLIYIIAFDFDYSAYSHG